MNSLLNKHIKTLLWNTGTSDGNDRKDANCCCNVLSTAKWCDSVLLCLVLTRDVHYSSLSSSSGPNSTSSTLNLSVAFSGITGG